jgi:hypothetical protein
MAHTEMGEAEGKSRRFKGGCPTTRLTRQERKRWPWTYLICEIALEIARERAKEVT